MTIKHANRLVICAVILLGLASFYSLAWANSTLRKKSEKLVNLRLENELADSQKTSLTQTNKDLATYIELEKIAKAVVPQDKDQAATVREIVKIADESGITLSSITFPNSTLGQAAPKPAANSEDSSSTAATQSTKAAPITQVQAVQGIAGVYAMEITVQQDIVKPATYDQFIKFLSRLEQNRRTAQVTSVNVQLVPGDRNKLSFKLVINAYIKP